MTSRKDEQEEQKRWKLREKFKNFSGFDRLLANEFLPPDTQIEKENAAAARIIGFARQRVPYYRDLYERLNLPRTLVNDPTVLASLPILSKRGLYEHQAQLRCARLPGKERLLNWFSSSGTTGRPARVLHTMRSNDIFQLLSHRNWRWFRFDPLKQLAYIRLAGQLPRTPGNKVLADGEILRKPSWRYIGRFFHTGQAVHYNVTNPVGRQIAMLCRERPSYLMSYPETLEHLAFASGGTWPGEPFEGLFAISEQLTEAMRKRIERTFKTVVQQNYGLNEIGLVATKCEAGRYHVHTEHCLVEIVDDTGQPCAPGESGRIVVTGLSNLAMPLIRYDTDDLAQAVDRNCPCGRTLPAFGAVAGRYSRIALLPEGTLRKAAVLQEAVESIPDALAAHLRQFQIFQFRSGDFQLRLVCKAKLPPAFESGIRKCWLEAGCRGIGLDFAYVDAIPRGPGGKYQAFDSEFYQSPEAL